MDHPLQYPPSPANPHPALINMFGIEDRDVLQRVEYAITAAASRETIDVDLSIESLQHLHQQLFGGVYPWAGMLRTFNMVKNQGHPDSQLRFCPHNLITDQLNWAFDHFGTLKPPQTIESFAERSAALANVINRVHPFPEGNGRTNKMFLTQWSRQQGFPVNYLAWPKKDWLLSSAAAWKGNERVMQHLTVEHYQKANPTKAVAPPDPGLDKPQRRARTI